MSETIEIPTLLSPQEYLKLPAEEKERYIKEILRQTFKQNPQGVTVTQLREKLSFDRRIIEKHLEIMEFTNEIYSFKLGTNRIYIPNHKAMHEASLCAERLGKYEYQTYSLKNKFGDFILIQQKNLERDSEDVAGGIQIPLEHYEKFVSYLSRTLTDMERRGIR